ncbi:MAG: DUF63 family protein [Candidatus Thermoplasmatota archaeon]|nr:DUF63 family protein [Candidatus Thermoplasmatota archaeon]MBU1941943.1 DUF63 family protein [Candidatus Thermoplasmatota archaeon]
MILITWIKTHLLLVSIIGICSVILFIIAGLLIAPEIFYDQWIWKYYWGPIVADAGGTPVHNGVYVQEGYTIVSEITYGIVLIVSLLGIYNLLKRLHIALNWPFFMALLPYIIYGPVTRVLEDTGYFIEPFVYWFISPLIYVQIAVVVLGYIVLGYWVLHKGRQQQAFVLLCGVTGLIIIAYWVIWLSGIHYGAVIIDPSIMTLLIAGSLIPIFYQYYHKKININGVVFSGGLLLLIPSIFLTAQWIAGYQWADTNGVRFDVFMLITGLVTVITVLVYLVGYRYREHPSIEVVHHPLNLAMIVGHMIDGLTSYVSIYDPLHMGIPLYVEKHPASDLLMQFWPPLFPIVKFVLILVIIYVFDVLYKKDLEQYGYLKNLLKIGIIILGFSPGVRDLLRVTMGV